ncbi:hypothetical protein [Paraburkholderia sediminicola]|uniref:hypothetical protein n=1 Tax=Paraburkholderia sediminicola TaxID=458836 RepID=UPI0038BD412B
MIAQFSDATETIVTGIFSSAQPVDIVEYQSEIEATDAGYKAWWNQLPAGTITLGLPDPE